MPYTIVDNFSAGLDNRRHILNSKPGTLAKAENVHITRGGEIEKRKAFIPIELTGTYNALNEVYGLESTSDGVYTFGFIEDQALATGQPFLPSPIKYQVLTHPWGYRVFDYIRGMDTPVLTTVFGGKIFAIAKYKHAVEWGVNLNHSIAFYDGVPIKNWYEGITRYINTGNFEIVQDSVSYFSPDRTPGYTAEAGYMGPDPQDPNFIRDLDGDTQIGDQTFDRSYVITGKPGIDFTVTPIQTDAFTVEAIETQKKIDYVGPTEATASLNIIGGSATPAYIYKDGRNMDAASCPGIRSIRVGASSPSASDGTDILGWTSTTGLRYDTFSPTYTTGSNWGSLLFNIAKVINDNSYSGLNHKYTANSYRRAQNSGNDTNSMYFYAPASDGEDANGNLVQIEFDANPAGIYDLYQLIDPASIIASPYNAGKFIATFGTLQGGSTNTIKSIKVDGIEILGQPVHWEQSNGYTASQAKIQLDAFSSSTEYDISISGSVISFKGKPGQGALLNNKSLRVETTGNVIVSTSGIFSGGINAVPARSKKVRVRYRFKDTMIGPKPGSKFGITITGADNPTDPIIVGASRMADTFGKEPSFVFTYKSKVYVGFDSVVYFSALNDCTKWGIYDLGSGFIDMSNNFGGREKLTGCGVYQDKMVFFTSRSSQTWYMDPDPSNNRQIQIIENSGSISAESIVSMGTMDLIYLGDDGFRSLRARESTDSAYANDTGSPIDDIIVKDMDTISKQHTYPVLGNEFFDFEETAANGSCRGIIEPIYGRLMMFLGNKIYVLSQFAGANISAWSVYHTALGSCRGVAMFKNRIYMLCNDPSGRMIHVYGGESGDQYDSCPVDVEMPYLDTGKPATYKEAKGIDITCEGNWQVYLGFDHSNVGARDLIANLSQSSFAFGRITATGYGTHFGPKFTSSAPGPAKIANFIVHYDDKHSKHEAG